MCMYPKNKSPVFSAYILHYCTLSNGSALTDEITHSPPPRRHITMGMGVSAAEGGVVAVVRRRGWGRVSERGWDYWGFDWDNPGVHDLTVHLHHHLITALRWVIHRICKQTNKSWVQKMMRFHNRSFNYSRIILICVQVWRHKHKVDDRAL